MVRIARSSDAPMTALAMVSVIARPLSASVTTPTLGWIVLTSNAPTTVLEMVSVSTEHAFVIPDSVAPTAPSVTVPTTAPSKETVHSAQCTTRWASPKEPAPICHASAIPLGLVKTAPNPLAETSVLIAAKCVSEACTSSSSHMFGKTSAMNLAVTTTESVWVATANATLDGPENHARSQLASTDVAIMESATFSPQPLTSRSARPNAVASRAGTALTAPNPSAKNLAMDTVCASRELVLVSVVMRESPALSGHTTCIPTAVTSVLTTVPPTANPHLMWK